MYTNISDFAMAVDIGKPLESLSEMLGSMGQVKFGYIGVKLALQVNPEESLHAKTMAVFGRNN